VGSLIIGVFETVGTYLYNGVKYIYERLPYYSYRPRSGAINEEVILEYLIDASDEAVQEVNNNPTIYGTILGFLGRNFSFFF